MSVAGNFNPEYYLKSNPDVAADPGFGQNHNTAAEH